MTRSGWIPYAFMAGFAVVLSANGALIYAATRQPVRLVVEKPYERGLAYNALLAEQQRQDALGWSMRLAPGRLEGDRLDLTVTFSERQQPLRGAEVQVTLIRPLEGDRVAALAYPAPDGRLVVRLDGLRPGQWQVLAEVRRGGDHARLEQKLVLK